MNVNFFWVKQLNQFVFNNLVSICIVCVFNFPEGEDEASAAPKKAAGGEIMEKEAVAAFDTAHPVR